MYAVQLFHPGKIKVQRNHEKPKMTMAFRPMLSCQRKLMTIAELKQLWTK